MEIIAEVNGKEYKHWSTVDIELVLDTVGSTFILTGLRFEGNDELFYPLGYPDCNIWLRDEVLGINEKLITGTVLNPGLSVQKVPQVESISGYSKPGILETSSMPQSLYPLQWKNTNLATLSKRIADVFSLTLKIHEGAYDKAYENFEEVKCGDTETVKSFLSRIGAEKGITISHDNLGNLFLYRILNVIPATSKISQDDYTIEMSTQPNGQQMHSEVTVRMDAGVSIDLDEGANFEQNLDMKYTMKSPFTDRFHPLTKKLKEGALITLPDYAELTLAKEARNLPITVTKLGWDFDGRIVRSGFFIEIEAPNILIENTKYVIDRMRFTKDAKGVKMLTMTCILPCVYTGKLPSKSPYIKR